MRWGEDVKKFLCTRNEVKGVARSKGGKYKSICTLVQMRLELDGNIWYYDKRDGWDEWECLI